MSTNFTKTIENSIWEIPNDDDISALEFLKNPSNFRSFSTGLTKLITRYGYTGAVDDIEAKTNFILHSLSSIEVTISKSTIKDWFLEKRRPALVSNSRTIMFQLAFALHTSIDDVVWFFHHVYFDRAFNCHTLEEAVYYYCFQNQLSYQHAQDLIAIAKTYPVNDATSSNNTFTNEIKNYITTFTSDEDFLHFLKNNISTFHKWNNSALYYINELVSQIRGKEADKGIVKTRSNYEKNITTSCGLVIQEYIYISTKNNSFLNLGNKNITSIDFMLEQILTTNTGLPKQADIPDIVTLNFPCKKTFSDILNKSDHLTSYDSLRKCLILLSFYRFWVSLLLNPHLIPQTEAFDIYLEETNALLMDCGYEKLFAGNPYDWLFLWASTTKSPLDTLRTTIGNLE